MIIDDSVKTQVGADIYNRWKDAALADLTNMLCMNTLDQAITDKMGVVGDDGQCLYLPSWYSEIWAVKTTDDTNLSYKVTYDKDDGLTPSTQYTHTVTLTNTLPAGTKVIVSGRHGFKRLPAPLTNILTAIIQADQSMADRSDSITSKKIEDVSVSYDTGTQTTLERALTPYKTLLSSWSICPIRSDTGGILSMPTPHYDLPWWMNEQDLGDNDYVIL